MTLDGNAKLAPRAMVKGLTLGIETRLQCSAPRPGGVSRLRHARCADAEVLERHGGLDPDGRRTAPA